MSSSQSNRTLQSPGESGPPNPVGMRSMSPYDRAFQQHLIDHDILPVGYEYPEGRLPPKPENIDEIRQALAQPRASLSPSKFTEEEFLKFERADAQAAKERDVTTAVIPIMDGDVGDRRCVTGGVPFANLVHLTDGTLVRGCPDRYYGARPEQLHRTIRRELNGKIIPSTPHDLPIAPNFYLEVKGPRGILSVATRQACYDGALGARGIHALQSYGQSEQRFDNKAYTITSIYYGGMLKMYTTHPIPPSTPSRQPGFIMTKINTWCLTNNADTFRQGAAAYLNGRDWAKQQRDDAIERANERLVRDEAAISPPVRVSLARSFASEVSAADTIATSQKSILDPDPNTPCSYESDTSTDELALELQPSAKRIRWRLRTPRKKP
ncbi:hypothetical protein HRG_004203 [Hirsutella rhossiliensis]|uniref:Uncharacterized protein n=1 Tax=Hirsutella rhossiliensis TaxID=111463 RepID=A0A9P8MYS6_9HYPO|nr:uncharacterized protein HRG_04203 [Hirsutella rhossiliensis]KAH0963775.1 hypothetical protein HRG_04203 [Hirsutella rhossiliensis]